MLKLGIQTSDILSSALSVTGVDGSFHEELHAPLLGLQEHLPCVGALGVLQARSSAVQRELLIDQLDRLETNSCV